MTFFARVYENNIREELGPGRTLAIYECYKNLRETSDELPTLNEIAIDGFLGLRDWVSTVEALPDGDFLYTHYGRKIEEATGFTMVGQRISETHSAAFGFFKESYERAIAMRRPVLTKSAALSSRSVSSWTRLVLPVRDSADRTCVVCVLQPVGTVRSLEHGLLEVSANPTFAIRMVRDLNEAVIDAEIVVRNKAAITLFEALGALPQTPLRGIMPTLFDTPLDETIAAAYREGQVVDARVPVRAGDHRFEGIRVAPHGDGAVIQLQPAA